MAEVPGLETLVNPCGRKDDATWHRATTASSRDRIPLQQQAGYAHAQCSPVGNIPLKSKQGRKRVSSLVLAASPIEVAASRIRVSRLNK